MGGYKLKTGVKIGAIAAELDDLLKDSFVDSGYLDRLSAPSDRHFILLGRTGTGKSALIRKLQENKSNKTSVVDPDNLSMQYLQNSQILRSISNWGVNLDIFYKFLWRHVLILELIRIRFQNTEEIPKSVFSFFRMEHLVISKKTKKENEIRSSAIKYLHEYGNEYWIKTDTRIKKITEELESSLSKNASVSAKIPNSAVDAGVQAERHVKTAQSVEKEIVDRAQSIVNDFLLSDLNKVLEHLANEGFNDEQKKYFILIDDLDKNWMYDDEIYLALLKSLLFCVADLNRKIPSLKIVVSLRENLYFRIFNTAAKHDPQKEKLEDQTLHIRWTEDNLKDLVDLRLKQVLRGQYSSAAPTFEQILPSRGKKINQGDPVEYILSRTLMRPRDLIDFLNIYFEKSLYLKNINWQSIRLAEAEYSKRRLDAVLDEWKDSFFGLRCIFPTFKNMNYRFSIQDIQNQHFNDIFSDIEVEKCDWLRQLQGAYIHNTMTETAIKTELIKALYRVGIIGSVDKLTAQVIYSYDQSTADIYYGQSEPETKYQIHPTFFSALKVKTPFS